MKSKMPLHEAQAIANNMIYLLKNHCRRVEIAGSIRREKQEIGDIEIVAVPLFADMFGVSTSLSVLDTLDWTDIGTPVKNGTKYKQIALKSGINLDLFIVTPPAQWGLIYLIRTGPWEFSKRMVTPKQHGGFMPSYLKVKDGAVWSNNHVIETPEEDDIFSLYGMSYIEPKDRL